MNNQERYNLVLRLGELAKRFGHSDAETINEAIDEIERLSGGVEPVDDAWRTDESIFDANTAAAFVRRNTPR